MSWRDKYKTIDVLVGKTITEIVGDKDSDELRFVCADGARYLMHHSQDCCESVSIEDINGDLADLIGSPVTLAEEAASSEPQPEQVIGKYDDGFTWTFYRLATAKGFVTIRWYGTSNGYYSETVDFVEETA